MAKFNFWAWKKQRKARPKSAGYEPLHWGYFTRMRNLPLFNFETIRMMKQDGEIKLALAARSAPLQSAEWAYQKGVDAQGKPVYVPGIEARRPEVAAFVLRQLKRIWSNHFESLASSQVWGWAGGEVTLRMTAHKMIEIDRLEPRHAMDCKVYQRDGQPCGVRIERVQNSHSIDLDFPNSYFVNHAVEEGHWYGTSALFEAHSAWADKWFDGGALDVRRLFMHKDAYGGVDLGYPTGDTYLTNRDTPVPNRDIARQIAEQLRAGGITTRPSERDENGNEKWPMQRATVPANPQHILQYPKDLDKEIDAGIGVSDDIIHNEGSGAWAGNRVRLAAFYASLDLWLRGMESNLTEFNFEPLVYLNFGRAEEFQISHKPLALQAMEQQSNAGQAGAPPAGGQPPPQGPGGAPPAPQQGGMFSRMALDAIANASPTEILRMAVAHSPAGGVDIDGTFYEGGEFIPDISQWEVDEAAKSQWKVADNPPSKKKPTESATDKPVTSPHATGETPIRGNGTPNTPSNKHVYTVPTKSLKIDPERFQYKITGIGDKGITKELKSVGTWNPELGGVLLVWRDPDTDDDYVVNGHHRHELASRTGTDEINVRYIDAPNAKLARARGALSNIAEGRGSAIDAAKYLRDVGADIDHLSKAGISLSGKVAGDAAQLIDLGDAPFQALTEGRIDEAKAVAVAKHLKDHKLQTTLFKKLAAREDDGKDWSIREIETAAKKLATAGSLKQTGKDLFGDWESEDSTFDQEVELESFISRQLSQHANDYRAVSSTRRAERVADAGNILATEENAKRQKTAEQSVSDFEREAGLRGAVSTAIKEHAVELAKAKTRDERNAVKDRTLVAVQAALSGDTEFARMSIIRMQVAHAPAGGVSIGGDDFKGGEFIPDVTQAEVDKAKQAQTPEVDPAKHAKHRSRLIDDWRTKSDDGHKIAIKHDARGYSVTHTAPDNTKTALSERHKTLEAAADAGAKHILNPQRQAVASPSLPDTKTPTKERVTSASDTPVTPAPAKPPKSIGAGNWSYGDKPVFGTGKKSKFWDNVAAIQAVRAIEAEGRTHATKEEQEKLSKYVGWGQFSEAFNTYNAGGESWDKERAQLKGLLSDDEWKTAESSTKNSHFTDPSIVKAHWKMAQRLGFKGGRYLEPSVGSGYYLGMMPQDISANTQTSAVEMDKITGRISQLLYPEAHVQVNPFQRSGTPDNFYDLVGSNVPFSGEVQLKHRGNRANLHDYYFMKSLDAAKPGGLVMHITSTGTMDSPNSAMRKYMDDNAELVSAIRLPAGTHKAGAGTEVVSDMLIFRKKNPAIPTTTDETPKDAEPKAPGFTGTTVDSLGRLYHWVDGKRVAKPEWGETSLVPDPAGGEPIKVNKYFADRPEQILGTLDRTGTMYRGKSVNVSMTDDFDTRLQSAIDRLPENIVRTDATPQADDGEPTESIEADKHYANGVNVLRDGKLYQSKDGALIPVKDGKANARISGLVEIREAARNLIASQHSGTGIDEARATLNEAYDKFVTKNGAIHLDDNRRALKNDPELPFLLSLEHWNSGTKAARKADIFNKDTIRQYERATKADNAKDAAGIVMHETGKLDTERIAKLLGRDKESIEAELVRDGIGFHDPSGGWLDATEYLSGNTRRKLAEARAAAAAIDPQFEHNVKALERSQPLDVDHQDIGIKLGSPWVPPAVIERFAEHILGGREGQVAVKHSPELGTWDFEWKSKYLKAGEANEGVWGVKNDDGTVKADFQDILEAALGDKNILIRSASKDDNGNHPILAEQTEAAREKVEDLRERFNDWVWQDPERRDMLHRLYNDTQNMVVERNFDGSHLTLPGMISERLKRDGSGYEPFEPRQQQKDFIWRVVSTGKGFAGHEVGTGKTASMVAAGMELRRLKLANKPAMLLKKANLEQITAEAQELYPGAKILAMQDFTKKGRTETLNRIMTGDYDLILMTHENFQGMKMRPENVAKYISEEVEEVKAAIVAAEAEAAANGENSKGNRIVKSLGTRLEKLEERLHTTMNEAKKDDIYFEDLGIDHIFVDEAHRFKTLPVYTKKGNVKGIPTGRSKRATDMLAKTRWLQETHNGRGVVFATGTPISNTMAELYTMQKYMQWDEMKERGVHRFDDWADTYGKTSNKLEFKLNGDIKATARFSEFMNLPELRHMTSSFMDIQLAENMKKADGSPAIVRPHKLDNPVTATQYGAMDKFMSEIHSRSEKVLKRRGKPEKGDDNMLSICNDAKLGSIDLRLVNENAGDDPGSKTNHAVRNVLAMYHAHPGTAQAIFSDLGIHPRGTLKKIKADKATFDDLIDEAGQDDSGDDDGTESDYTAPRVIESKTKFSVFNDIIDKLVAGGIPRDQIVNFSDPSIKGKKREDAQDAINRGEVRIALGSTDRLGTGTNIQSKLYAVHHLDVPYRPADMEQRIGRAYRHGNSNKQIENVPYVQAGSADNMFWQILARKTHFIHQYIRGSNNRHMEELDTDEISPEQMIAIATGDEGRIEEISLQDDVRKLRRSEQRHKTTIATHQAQLSSAAERRQRIVDRHKGHVADVSHLKANPEFDFSFKYPGTSERHDKRPEAAESLSAAIEFAKDSLAKPVRANFRGNYRDDDDAPETLDIGKYRGLNVAVRKNGMLAISGTGGQEYESGPSLQSLETVVRNISKQATAAQLAIDQFDIDQKKVSEAAGSEFKQSAELADKEKRLAELKTKTG